MRILGLKKAVGEIKSVPEGFHMEVWSELKGDEEVAVWTTEYLSSNSWTVNHDISERRLDAVMREIDDGRMSLTEQIRRAVDVVWEDGGLLDAVLSKDREWNGSDIALGRYVLHVHEWGGAEAEDWEPDEDGYVPTGYVYADLFRWEGKELVEVDGACVGYGEDTTLRQWIQGVFPDIL